MSETVKCDADVRLPRSRFDACTARYSAAADAAQKRGEFVSTIQRTPHDPHPGAPMNDTPVLDPVAPIPVSNFDAPTLMVLQQFTLAITMLSLQSALMHEVKLDGAALLFREHAESLELHKRKLLEAHQSNRIVVPKIVLSH